MCLTGLGRVTKVSARHNRDNYGFMSEIDVPHVSSKFYTSIKDKGDGAGHRKIGAMGRARWENLTVAGTGQDMAAGGAFEVKER